MLRTHTYSYHHFCRLTWAVSMASPVFETLVGDRVRVDHWPCLVLIFSSPSNCDPFNERTRRRRPKKCCVISRNIFFRSRRPKTWQKFHALIENPCTAPNRRETCARVMTVSTPPSFLSPPPTRSRRCLARVSRGAPVTRAPLIKCNIFLFRHQIQSSENLVGPVAVALSFAKCNYYWRSTIWLYTIYTRSGTNVTAGPISVYF